MTGVSHFDPFSRGRKERAEKMAEQRGEGVAKREELIDVQFGCGQRLLGCFRGRLAW